jgi:hypothetical protein
MCFVGSGSAQNHTVGLEGLDRGTGVVLGGPRIMPGQYQVRLLSYSPLVVLTGMKSNPGSRDQGYPLIATASASLQ